MDETRNTIGKMVGWFSIACLLIAVVSCSAGLSGIDVTSSGGIESGGDGTGDDPGGGGATKYLTMPSLTAIRTALGQNNPVGMVPGGTLGAIVLPECTSQNIDAIVYSLSGLPSWLAFDPATRAITLSGVATVPESAVTASPVTYLCSEGASASLSAPSVEMPDLSPTETLLSASRSFDVNDIDGGGVTDASEHLNSAVPLASAGLGWVRLTSDTHDMYVTESGAIPNGIVVVEEGMDPRDPSDDVADFDDDGLNNATEILQGSDPFVRESDGTFANEATITVTNSRDLAIADIDDDGDGDILVARNDGSYTILRNDGGFSFNASSPAAPGSIATIAIADFNGDLHDVGGGYDIALATGIGAGSYVIATAHGLGNATFETYSTLPSLATNMGDIAGADLDGDGDVDVAVSFRDPTAGAAVNLNAGTGIFGAYDSYLTPITLGGYGLRVADMDDDGALDLVVSRQDSRGDLTLYVSLLWGRGDGSFEATSTDLSLETAIGNPEDVDIADIDGDGDLDFAVVINKGAVINDVLRTYQNSGGRSFALLHETNLGNVDPIHLAFADINGDGDVDLLITNYRDHSVSILFGDGAGNFTGSNMTDACLAYPRGIAVADIDADGDLDFAVTSQSNICVYENEN